MKFVASNKKAREILEATAVAIANRYSEFLESAGVSPADKQVALERHDFPLKT